jgi:hypothetical protein
MGLAEEHNGMRLLERVANLALDPLVGNLVRHVERAKRIELLRAQLRMFGVEEQAKRAALWACDRFENLEIAYKRLAHGDTLNESLEWVPAKSRMSADDIRDAPDRIVG